MDTELEQIEAALQNNEQTSAAERAREYLEKLENTPLNIAVTGESGSGKSSFVNALRGLNNRHKDAAPTGSVETTMEVKEYILTNLPNVTIWDLPGIGTTKFTDAKYLKYVKFEKYDFFIIVSSERFRENDAKLAKEIRKMEKKFYFVRSKIDDNMRAETRSQKDFDEETGLKRIRDNCIKELLELGMESPQVFLVSRFDLHLYDFEDLCQTFQRDLPEHKRDVLLHGLPVTSLTVLEEKIKSLENRIKYYALLSAAGAAVPIPGVSIAADIILIVGFVKICQNSLGLTEGAVQRLSEATGVSVEEIRAEIKSPFTGVEITNELVITSLKWQVSVLAGMALEEGSRFIPLLGIPVAISVSYVTTSKVLKCFLELMAEDAQRVFTKVFSFPSSV